MPLVFASSAVDDGLYQSGTFGSYVYVLMKDGHIVSAHLDVRHAVEKAEWSAKYENGWVQTHEHKWIMDEFRGGRQRSMIIHRMDVND
jgi:hypothetical protein